MRKSVYKNGEIVGQAIVFKDGFISVHIFGFHLTYTFKNEAELNKKGFKLK